MISSTISSDLHSAMLRLLLVYCLAMGQTQAWAGEGLPLGPVGLDSRGRTQVTLPSDPGFYYCLSRTPELSNIGGLMVDVQLGTGQPLQLTDSIAARERAFFRVTRFPFTRSGDLDGDGVHDFKELSLGGTQSNALNPARSVSYADGAVRLPLKADFDGISHRDSFPGAPSVQEVKFLITGVDTARPELYFLNFNKHPYHYYFARGVLNYRPDLEFYAGLTQFNGETYWSGVGSRKNLAGSLVVHENWDPPNGGPQGIVTMEFWPSDPVAYQHVQMAYDLISRSIPWLGIPLAYHAASEPQRFIFRQEAAAYAEAQRSKLRIISTQELFGQTSYTMLNPGVGFGMLTVFDGTSRVGPRDVVIFRNIPNEITRLAGIITELPQTPLSHINLKAKQNDTPNAFIRDASGLAEVIPLIGKYVRFETTGTGFLMREATAEEVETYMSTVRPANPQFPQRDLTKTTIKSLRNILFTESRAYGAKATNVAELGRMQLYKGVKTPSGYGVPFYFYDEFMKANRLYDYARSIVTDESFITEPEIRDAALKELRKRIRAATFPPVLLTALTTVQASFASGLEIRCRSSTNNEDLTGYSGAGLYESFTHRPDEGHLEKTIKQVYASLWLQRAFDEREFYRVDHFTTAMGVLLHTASDGEQANGVGVTKNLVDPNWTGYYVNAQIGENLVTNPAENSVPEEFLIARLLGSNRYTIQYVTFSNQVPQDTKVLTTAQAELLADQMARIQSWFQSKYAGPPGFAMEIEWKIELDGSLLIKQARPWVE